MISTPLLLLLVLALLNCTVDAWSIIERPLNFFDLNNNDLNYDPIAKQFLYEYSSYRGGLDQFRLLKHDEGNKYIILGAKDRILSIRLNANSQVQIKEYDVPKYPEADELEYILAMVPIEPSVTNLNNMLICKSGSFCPRCIQSQFNVKTGLFYSFNATVAPCAPQFVNQRSLENVMYYTQKSESETNEHILFTASTQAGGRQYVSLYGGNQDGYQSSRAYKYVGQKAGKSKEFIKFLENNEKVFLFQHMNNKIVDPLERSRDISESAALVSQICKNDEGAGDFKELYSELQAQINCFKDATPLRGSSGNFRFEILKFMSDFVQMKRSNETTKRLFYGVFNTPEYTPTGTAICFFDINDIERVFQLDNFDYEMGEEIQNYKFDASFQIQNCPSLTHNEKEKAKYRSLTNQLRRMKNGAYPVRRRKASFMTLHRYRITSLVVDQIGEAEVKAKLVGRGQEGFSNLNVIYAGTDNGKVLRIAHYFTDGYFTNDEEDEEHVEVLEEIQMFGNDTTVNQIRIVENNGDKQVLAITLNEMKSVPSSFCELYSSSCDSCVSHNHLDENKCHWYNNACISTNHFNKIAHETFAYAGDLDQCQLLRITTTTSTTQEPSTTTTTTTTTTSTTTTTTRSATTTLRVLVSAKQPYPSPQPSPLVINNKAVNKSNNGEDDSFLIQGNSKFLTIFILCLSFIAILTLGMCTGYVFKSTDLFGKSSPIFRAFKSSRSSFDLSKKDNSKNKQKINLYQDTNTVSSANKSALEQSSKIRLARSWSGKMNESVEKSLDFANSSMSSDNSNMFDKYCICTGSSKKAGVKNTECFTVQRQNDYSLMPHLQQSLPPEYFKVSNSLQAQVDKTEDKHRLSSDSSTDSSYLFNLANYSQTSLVRGNNNNNNNKKKKNSQQSSPLANSTTKSIVQSIQLNDTTDSSNIYFPSTARSTITSKFGHINTGGSSGGSIYQQAESNCIIVDDDEGNFEASPNSAQKTAMDKIILDHNKRCSILSSNLSFSASSETSSTKSTAGSKDSSKYYKHHHAAKQAYNPYESSSKLVIKSLPRGSENELITTTTTDNPPAVLVISTQQQQQQQQHPNNEADVKNSIEEFYVNNSYV